MLVYMPMRVGSLKADSQRALLDESWLVGSATWHPTSTLQLGCDLWWVFLYSKASKASQLEWSWLIWFVGGFFGGAVLALSLRTMQSHTSI